MEKEKAIEIFNRQINCYKTDREECVSLASCSHCNHNVTPEELTEAMQMAISALEKQKRDRWIPCKERLPEVGQSVIITVAGIYTAEGCLKDDGNWCQFRWSAEHKPAIVGAWKPLPEPYKAEEDND